IDVVSLLIANSADPMAATDSGKTPVHAAAFRGHRDVANFLVANGARWNIHAASACGELEEVDGSLRDGTDIDVAGLCEWTPLHWAALRGGADAVKFLLDHGASVEALGQWGGTPLHFAAMGGDPDVTELLLGAGANANTPNGSGATPLHDAASQGHLPLVELLIDNGADVDAVTTRTEETATDMATSAGHDAVVARLSEAGADH
ncbi:MAG TPA: ankyrin repeat domain-containing protein, partial [Armatimonadota bacterium]|nr:ankyrin repeat domain-containing protein [Armatimonadota bacterium]